MSYQYSTTLTCDGENCDNEFFQENVAAVPARMYANVEENWENEGKEDFCEDCWNDTPADTSEDSGNDSEE